MRVARWVALGVATLALAANDDARRLLITKAWTQAGSTVVPQPVPSGFGFPADATTVNGWVNNADVAAMRTHAWSLWAGMTSPSGQIGDGKDLPIWETWLGSDDIFPPSTVAPQARTAEALLQPRPRALRVFEQPLQFRHNRALPAAAAAAIAASSNVVSFNKFDPEAATFIVSPQAGPGGAMFHYNQGNSLGNLNQAWPPNTTGQNRAINEFPVRAIETKPVFSLVKQSGLTPQPLWQGPGGSTNPNNPTPGTWTTCVLIDPNGSGAIRAATPAEIAAKNNVRSSCTTYLYGPLSLLYSFQLTAAEAASYNSAQGAGAAAGDYAVLVAMHVNTKEIPFWTWQTYYWQPGDDTPNGFPGSKVGQPATLPAPWNNYAMCTNYNQTAKPGSGTMDVCLNPYLETSPSIPAGITSNCMSCHGTARIGDSGDYPPNYNAPIDFFGDAAYFNGNTTHTDFSWAIPAAP